LRLSFWRWAIASALLLPLRRRAAARRDAPIIRRQSPRALRFRGDRAADSPCSATGSVRYTTAVNATLLNSSLPLFVVRCPGGCSSSPSAAGSSRDWRCRSRGRHHHQRGGAATLARLSLNPGDLLLIGGALLWASIRVLLKWRPPLRPLSFLFSIVAAGAAFSLPFYLWEISAGGAMVLSHRTIAALGYLAVFPPSWPTSAGTTRWPWWGPTWRGSSIRDPLVRHAVCRDLARRAVRPYHLAGFVLILGGVVLTSRR